MVEKYYTPTIEEFCVGFECELRNSSGKNYEWEPFKIVGVDDGEISGSKMDWSFYDSANAIKDEMIRVKYLDKQDIEECGWHSEMVVNVWSEDDDIIDGYVINKNNTDTYVLLHSEEGNIVGIYLQRIYNEFSGNWEEHRLFSGYINNKSELKNIMKMINIF